MKKHKSTEVGSAGNEKRKVPKTTKSKFQKKKSKLKGNMKVNTPRSTGENSEAQVKKAATYLKTWKKDRNSWKFEKMKQVWLIKHMFASEKVKSKHFQIFVDYIANSQGKARQEVLEKALKMVRYRDKWTELQDQGLSDEDIALQNPDLQTVSDLVYSRARLIIQAIPEDF